MRKIYSRKERENARRQKDRAVGVERKEEGKREEEQRKKDGWGVFFRRIDDGGKAPTV